MKLFNKAIKIMPLFLMAGLITGVCVNTHESNNDLIVAKAAESNPRTIMVYGDYDRFGSVPGQHKPGPNGEKPVREWKDNAIVMNYHEAAESYYDAYLTLKKGDKLKIVLQGATENEDVYIGYVDYLGNAFDTDKDKNLVAKMDGTYYLKYGVKGLNDASKESGWRSGTGKTLLPTKNIYFKYDIDDIANNQGVAGLESYKKLNETKTLAYSAWHEVKQYEKVGDWYKQDFATAIAMGFDKLKITDTAGQYSETNELDLSFMTNLYGQQDVYINVLNNQGSQLSVSFDVNQQRENEESHLTNATSRVWLDKGESFKQDQVFTGLHIWGHDKVVEFLPTRYFEINPDVYRNVCYFDIPNEFFNDGYLMMIKGYHNNSGYFSHGSTNWGTKDINTNKMMYVTPKDGKDTLSIGNALNPSCQMSFAKLATVLESYYTCDPSTRNGYGDFKSFEESWLGFNKQSNKYDFIIGGGDNSTMKDFLNKEDYLTGNNKTKDVGINVKIGMMQQNYENTLHVNNIYEISNNNVMIIVILSGMAIVLAAGFILIYARRKKANK